MKTRSIFSRQTKIHTLVALFFFLGLLSACSSYFVATKQNYQLVEINDQLQPSDKIVDLTAPYKQQLEAEMNRVIGQSKIRLTKPGTQSETLLGNFFTDVMLEEGRKFDPDIQIAFATKGGLRIELPKGPITVSHIFELMPFENKLTILEMSGESIQQLADFIASSGGQPVAGLRMNIKNSQAKDIYIAGKKLDQSKKYKLITYDYLANGGDNSRGLTQPITRKDLDLKVRECLLQFVENKTKQGQEITSTLDGRVTNN